MEQNPVSRPLLWFVCDPEQIKSLVVPEISINLVEIYLAALNTGGQLRVKSSHYRSATLSAGSPQLADIAVRETIPPS
jgi:hypothetical protein